MGIFDQNITAVAGVVSESGTEVCVIKTNRRFAGVFFGNTPFAFSTPLLFMQLSLSSLLVALLQQVLTPLGESAFISQMLVGIILGPSGVGKLWPNVITTIFPGFSIHVNETFAMLGCMLYMFLMGVRMDLGMIKRSGKNSVIIGVSAFFLPLMINTIMAILMKDITSITPEQRKSIPFIASFQSLSTFHVIACVLSDLKLLNSELGRLASCSSMISGMCSWVWIIISFSAQQSIMAKDNSFVWMVFSVFCLVFFVVFILRPILIWMINRIPENKPIKESYMCAIFLMILLTSFMSEVIGQHFMFGPIVLGIALPDGPPLGSALVERLDSFISSIFLPSYFVFIGSRLSASDVHWNTFTVVEILSLTGFAGKLIGSMVPALYANMPAIDAFLLGLVMSAQGIMDVLVLQQSMLLQLIDRQSYSDMLLSMVLLTGVVTPIVKFFYNPSKRYTSIKKRTIQQSKSDTELRILACIHHQDNTPPVIELLRLSNPTPRKPVCFYAVHLMELIGRSTPLLVFHRSGKKNHIRSFESDHIINAFRTYEGHNQSSVVVNLYTAVSPYASMHDEICIIAADKRVSMVIVPFHEHWTLHGREELPKQVRTVNETILRMAPCSVGILVDRGTLTGYKQSLSSAYSIAIVFVGGGDDREALAYALRMGEHPDVTLTMVRIIEPKSSFQGQETHQSPDDKSVSEFKMANINGTKNKHHILKEEQVVDSVELVSVLRSMQNCYDLILVGRRHDSWSPLFTGLTDWNEFPELGYIGDMLASSDSDCQVSLLVVQQQVLGHADDDYTTKFASSDDPVAVVDISRDNNKIYPAF